MALSQSPGILGAILRNIYPDLIRSDRAGRLSIVYFGDFEEMNYDEV